MILRAKKYKKKKFFYTGNFYKFKFSSDLSRSPSPDVVDTWTMETDALMVEIAKLESNPRYPVTPPAQVPAHKLFHKDESNEVPKVLKANVAPIPPTSIPASVAVKKNVTKGKFFGLLLVIFASIGYTTQADVAPNHNDY